MGGTRSQKPRHKCHKQLSADLESAFHNKDFADVKVACGDRVFECHQFMLSSRSPVFRAMFQSDMTEAATKRVDIQDLQPDTVNDMLLYIYTGNPQNLAHGAGDLLAAADKYHLSNLRGSVNNDFATVLRLGTVSPTW